MQGEVNLEIRTATTNCHLVIEWLNQNKYQLKRRIYRMPATSELFLQGIIDCIEAETRRLFSLHV